MYIQASKVALIQGPTETKLPFFKQRASALHNVGDQSILQANLNLLAKAEIKQVTICAYQHIEALRNAVAATNYPSMQVTVQPTLEIPTYDLNRSDIVRSASTSELRLPLNAYLLKCSTVLADIRNANHNMGITIVEHPLDLWELNAKELNSQTNCTRLFREIAPRLFSSASARTKIRNKPQQGMLYKNAAAHKTARLEGTVFMGRNSYISHDTILRNCIVTNNTFVGPNLILENKYIDGPRIFDFKVSNTSPPQIQQQAALEDLPLSPCQSLLQQLSPVWHHA